MVKRGDEHIINLRYNIIRNFTFIDRNGSMDVYIQSELHNLSTLNIVVVFKNMKKLHLVQKLISIENI